MFGKPEWFRDRKIGWGLTPISWQGWLYTAVWGAVIAAPFALLISRENPLGAGVWLTASILAIVWDVHQIKRARRTPTAAAGKEPALYIGDEEAMSTKNLDLRLRR
jgi:hypothetical protein